MAISNFEKARLANLIAGDGTYTKATKFVVKLFYDAVDENGVGQECDADGYQPIEVDNNAINFPTTTNGVKGLAVVHRSQPFQETSAPIVSIGVFDTDDNLISYKVLPAPEVVLKDQEFILSIDGLTFTVITE